MSPTDPCAAWTTRGRNKVMFGYSLNYLIDMENAVILDVEATPTRLSKEADATETMIDGTEDRFGPETDRIAGCAKSRPVSYQDVIATLYQRLGIDTGKITIDDPSGRPRYLVEEGKPISELI